MATKRIETVSSSKRASASKQGARAPDSAPFITKHRFQVRKLENRTVMGIFKPL